MIASETNIPSPLQVNLQSRVVSRTRGFFWLPLVSILALCFAIITTTAGEVSSTNSLTPYEMRDVKVRAELGGAKDQFIMGQLYSTGDGVSKDLAKAVKWFLKAAEQGDTIAQFQLGICYAKGIGVDKNPTESVRWVEKVAEKDDPNAQLLMGCALASGNGLPKDRAAAYKWMLLAADKGGKLAKKTASDFGQQITDWDAQKGKRMAQEFRESKGAPAKTAPR